MTLEEVIGKFLESPKRMDMGAGKLSRRWKCSKEDIYVARSETRKILKNRENKGELPKILVLDIETAPVRAYVWRLWKQNVYLPQIISDWFMLTWAAKWLFDENTMSDRLTKDEVIAENDKRLVKGLRELLDEADVVIAHNGDAFDIPKINSRLIVNNLDPVSPYQKIDTKKVAAKEFGFSSNKLDALATHFNLENKIDTDFELWSECMKGNEKSLKYMETYNVYDVELLEAVYLRLRPWIKSHPSTALFIESENKVCPSCGHDHLTQKGTYRTQVSVFDTYQCNSCGAISRSRKNKVKKETKENLLVSVGR